MSFLALPAEIRRLIYREFLLDNAPAQHIGTLGGASYARFPCKSVPDHVFLQDVSRSCGDISFGDYVEVLRYSAWRNGHLACDPVAISSQGERLPSPVPLFLTCRQVYMEASVYVYNTPLMLHDWDTTKSLLGRAGGAFPIGLTSIQIIELLPLGDFPVGRDIIYTLACLDLSSTTIRILGPLNKTVVRLLHVAMATSLWHKAVALEIVEPVVTEVKTWQPANGCPVTRRPDASWLTAFHRYLYKRGGISFTRDVLDELSSYDVLEKVAGELGIDLGENT
ncbi:uncharacterized protein PG998_011374 [Apiospora kogelbergensis]|uniref:uncharacterized protein n=1 Tax=Apiospora kogelbergensis TaxID=1337665 RepID=UPI00312F05BB